MPPGRVEQPGHFDTSRKSQLTMRLRGSRAAEQAGGGRDDGEREETGAMNEKTLLQHIYLSVPIHLSASLAFKTSAPLTLIACCHIFIPQKALEKPPPGRVSELGLVFASPGHRDRLGYPQRDHNETNFVSVAIQNKQWAPNSPQHLRPGSGQSTHDGPGR